MADSFNSTLVDTVRSPPTEDLINLAVLIFEELRNTHWQMTEVWGLLDECPDNFYAPN